MEQLTKKEVGARDHLSSGGMVGGKRPGPEEETTHHPIILITKTGVYKEQSLCMRQKEPSTKTLMGEGRRCRVLRVIAETSKSRMVIKNMEEREETRRGTTSNIKPGFARPSAWGKSNPGGKKNVILILDKGTGLRGGGKLC